MTNVIEEKNQSEPYLLVLGTWSTPVEVFVIIDQEVLCEVEIKSATLAIISAFFVFNICYIKSLVYVFTFLEILLNLSPKIPPTVSNFHSA